MNPKGGAVMIYGKKVKLRPIEENDLPLMVQWFNDPEIARSVVGWDFPISLAQQKEWYRNSLNDRKNQRWIIENLDGEVLGLTGLWDIDWHNRQALNAVKLGRTQDRGKGYGTDTIMAVMAYAFLQVGLNRLWGEIIDYNIGSFQAYVENCGWKVEGKLRKSVFRDGTYRDIYRVAILKDEFMSLDKASEYIKIYNHREIKVKNSHWAVIP
jgi:RimJ/RimL family protein N-acetyltransferase